MTTAERVIAGSAIVVAAVAVGLLIGCFLVAIVVVAVTLGNAVMGV